MDQLLQRHHEKIKHRKLVIQSYRARTDAKRKLTDKVADLLTAKFGTVAFLLLNAIWFTTWIVVNSGLIAGITPFDPYPFGLLTSISSLEAIFLATTVLISQNRAARIAEIREEIDLQITTMGETEISKVIYMMTLLLKKSGVEIKDDPELAEMLRPINNAELEKIIEDQLS